MVVHFDERISQEDLSKGQLYRPIRVGSNFIGNQTLTWLTSRDRRCSLYPGHSQLDRSPPFPRPEAAFISLAPFSIGLHSRSDFRVRTLVADQYNDEGDLCSNRIR